MKIIDFHAHCYPDDVWPKVNAAITKTYGKSAENAGTVDGLISSMESAGINLSVVQPVANQAKHVGGVNKWVESIRHKHGNLLFFAAIHPAVEDPYQVVCDLAAKGFKGVKMQPNAGRYYPNSNRCFEIYRALEENNMVLLTHAGDELKPYTPLYAHPKYFREVFKSFPDLVVVLAHLGGYNTWGDLEYVLGYDNVYYDTAMSCEIGEEKFLGLVEEIGVDRVIFGTDYPWYKPEKAVGYTKRILGGDAEKVLSLNAMKLLGI